MPHRLLVCVCGGIAAYKVCEVVSRLAQSGVAVTVAMTAEAQRFVAAQTFQTLSNQEVHTDLWDKSHMPDPPHIHLARDAELILVAPATANTMAKFANGLSDDLVSAIFLAAEPKKILLAPAMNETMWRHPATQRNVETLQGFGVQCVGPGDGWQACRTTGTGRMSEAAEIVDAVTNRLKAPAA